MKPLIIIKAGSTLPSLIAEQGDFEQWITAGIGNPAIPVQVLDPRRGAPLPAPGAVSGAIVTGSPAMVTERKPWSESVARWLAELVACGTPVLGICYGHQLLAHALGGEVDFHPEGMEIGTVSVHQTREAEKDILFKDLPKQFLAQVIHRQSITRLPDGAVRLAENAFESNHAFRFGESAWGIQFHPEFTSDVMRSYLDYLAEDLRKEKQDVASLNEKVAPADEAAGILNKFGSIVLARHQA